MKYISEKLSHYLTAIIIRVLLRQDDRYGGNRTGEIICVYLSDGDIDITDVVRCRRDPGI